MKSPFGAHRKGPRVGDWFKGHREFAENNLEEVLYVMAQQTGWYRYQNKDRLQVISSSWKIGTYIEILPIIGIEMDMEGNFHSDVLANMWKGIESRLEEKIRYIYPKDTEAYKQFAWLLSNFSYKKIHTVAQYCAGQKMPENANWHKDFLSSLESKLLKHSIRNNLI